MKRNPTRYSSAVGKIWAMATFKIKYFHKIFDIQGYHKLTDALLNQEFRHYKINCRKLTFNSGHVHIILDMGLYSKIELAKKINGFVGKKLLEMTPSMKKKYFWVPVFGILHMILEMSMMCLSTRDIWISRSIRARTRRC